MLVVDRDPEMPVHRMIAARRNGGVAGHDPGRDAPVILIVLGLAARPDIEAARRLDHFEDRREIAEIILVAGRPLEQRIGIDIAAVQEGDVARIDAALHRLQPIAFLETLRDEALLARHRAEFEFRQIGLAVFRPHIGPQDAAALDERIGGELDLLGVAALHRLRRHHEALAVHVEFPAVIGAAQPAFLVAPEPQRGAAMGAEFVDEPELAVAVAEGDQPLGEDLHPDRRTIVLGQFFAEQGRQPVAAEKITHRRAGAGLGHEIVLFLLQHR